MTAHEIFEKDIREFGRGSYLRQIGFLSWDIGKWLKGNDVLVGSGYTIVRGVEGPSIHFHDRQVKVEQDLFDAYERWRKESRISLPGQPHSLESLRHYGEDRGIKISIAPGTTVKPELAEYLRAVLDIFPDIIFQKYTRDVWLTSGPYPQQSRTIHLDTVLLEDLSDIRSRLNVIRHCLYRVLRDVSSDYRAQNHSLMSAGKILEGHAYEGNYEMISGHNKSRAEEKREHRDKYEHDLPRDFLDMTVFNYIVDGQSLRTHIQKLQANAETRNLGRVYREVYDTLKKEVFGGRTYPS